MALEVDVRNALPEDSVAGNFSDFPSCKSKDLNNIPWKSEEEIVRFLKRRFTRGDFYTWAGLTLVAVNPCQEIPALYSERQKELYNAFGEDGNTDLQPHIYAVAARTRHRLVYEVGKINQVIVISGDSGSGKTYSYRQILNFLATYGFRNSNYDVAQVPDILWQIWCSVPILSAFGNAQTECNSNSSRFGKLLQLQYVGGNILGASLQTYLLEKTRVTSQGENECNFHVFHQLLSGLSPSELASLNLSTDGKYRIIPGPRKTLHQRGFFETSAALLELGVSQDQRKQVFMLLAAIIHLGNVYFIEENDAFVVDEEVSDMCSSIHSASHLLGLEDSCLKQLLTTRQISTQLSGRRRPTIYRKSAGSIEECNTRRDCIMRFLYEQLFLWIVSIINTKVRVENSSLKQLGLLDIYGFETMKHNSLEQLCINYANERLQLCFVQDVLLRQQQILLEEGLETHVSSLLENEERLKLLDAPISVFGILNEESALQRYSSDKVICQRIVKTLGENKFLVAKNACNATHFTVRHYAGEVTYSVNKMFDKNTDKVPGEIVDFLGLSSSYFIRQLLHQWSNSKPGKCHKHTLLSKFKSSLDDLIKILKKVDVQYVRCIKATPSLVPGAVDTEFLHQQLRASGILEAVSLSQQHFPISLKYTEFEDRYGILRKTANHETKEIQTGKPEMVRQLLEQVLAGFVDENVIVGKFSLFLTDSAIVHLEDLRHRVRKEAAKKIQRAWRNLLERRNAAALVIQKFYRRSCSLKLDFVSKTEESLSTKKQDISEIKERDEPQVIVPLPKFFRIIHIKDHIISRMALAKIPIWFHVKRTCLPYSHVLPHAERAKGLPDALE